MAGRRQRAIGADSRRVDDLRAIALAIQALGEKQLPSSVADLPHGPVVNLKDPVTKAIYEYRQTSATTFELCATFATASAADDFPSQPRPARWDHPQGRHCYRLDTRDGSSYCPAQSRSAGSLALG